MGNEDEGNTKLTLQGLKLDLHLATKLAVKRCQRFVEEQDLGFVNDGAGQGHALLLAA